MNPFSNPPRIMVQTRPQDMRAGIQRLATIVEAELGQSPADGTLWCFAGRGRRKAKMLRFDSGAWCLWYVRLSEGAIRWERDGSLGRAHAGHRPVPAGVPAGRRAGRGDDAPLT